MTPQERAEAAMKRHFGFAGFDAWAFRRITEVMTKVIAEALADAEQERKSKTQLGQAEAEKVMRELKLALGGDEARAAQMRLLAQLLGPVLADDGKKEKESTDDK